MPIRNSMKKLRRLVSLLGRSIHGWQSCLQGVRPRSGPVQKCLFNCMCCQKYYLRLDCSVQNDLLTGVEDLFIFFVFFYSISKNKSYLLFLWVKISLKLHTDVRRSSISSCFCFSSQKIM